MSTVDAMIHCAGCGRQSPWKPQYAGRKLRCKCGHVIEVRAAPVEAADPEPPEILDEPPGVAEGGVGPAESEASMDDLLAAAAAEATAPESPLPQANPLDSTPHDTPHDTPHNPLDEDAPPLALQADAHTPRQTTPVEATEKVADDDDFGAYGLAPMAAIPVTRVPTAEAYDPADDDDDDDDELLPPTARPPRGAAAAVAPASPILGYKSFQRPRNVEEEEQVAAYQRKEMILPAILIAVGLLATFVEARLTLGEFNILAMTVFVAVSTVVNLVLIFAALLIASKLMDLGLGEVGPALLKIAAVAILPSAIGGMIVALTGGFGGLLAWGVTLGLYFLLLYNLFEMDGQEMMITTVIIWFMRTWVAYFIIMGILGTGGDDDLDPSLQPGGGGGGGNNQWVAPDGSGDGSGAVDSDGDGIPDEPTDPDDPDDPDAEARPPKNGDNSAAEPDESEEPNEPVEE